jgi:hypothetical protein
MLHRRVRCIVRAEAGLGSIRSLFDADTDRNDGRPDLLDQIGKADRLLRWRRRVLGMRGFRPLKGLIASASDKAGNGNQGYAGEQGDAPLGHTSRLGRFVRIIVSHDRSPSPKKIADCVSVLAET